MKRLVYIVKNVAACLVLASLSCSGFVSCESYDDSAIQEAIKDLQNRVTALEKKVQENISAIQSMVSLGSITSCEYNTETGKTVITLLDGKTFTIEQKISGPSLVTVVEQNGKYYWGICKNGKSEILMIDGKAVPVEVTPAAKLSDKGEWLISADGGSTWISTGIFHNSEDENTEVEFFKDVVVDGDYLLLTLADGKVIKVEIVGEASFSASETSLFFTRKAEEKMVPLSMKNVKAFTITEKPEGWKAQIIEEVLHISSPKDIENADLSGSVKILAVFNGRNPEIVSIDVQYEPELTLSSDTYGTVKVTVSEHVATDYLGYIIKAWKASEYTAEAVAAWMNSEGYSASPYTVGKEFTIAELADSFAEDQEYVIFAFSYIPPRLITSGENAYKAEDILTVKYSPVGTNIQVSNISFDSATIKADFSETAEYFAGISELEDWNNYVKKNFLEQLGYGGMTPYTAASYEGAAALFPDGSKNITILPSTEYIIWMIPYNAANTYTESDFVTKTFTTSGISANSSIAAPVSKVYNVTYGGFTADITPAAGAYKTYATILPVASIPSDEAELMTLLIDTDKYSEASNTLTVSTNSYNSNSEIYLIAVSLDSNGNYGSILKERVSLKTLTYSDAVGISDCQVKYGLGDVTLTLTFKGEPSTITYMAASYTYYTNEVIQEMMAMGQYGDVINKSISTLTDGNKIHLSNLEIGAQYTFYAVVKDAEGTPSQMYTCTFIPSISIDYVTSSSDNYTYGMPQLSGSWVGNTSYSLSVSKPAECTKFWLFKGDSEYFTGDVWTDTDKLVTSQLYGVEIHEASITAKTYSYMNSASRFYIAWLDDKGEYHAIYEYNPNK